MPDVLLFRIICAKSATRSGEPEEDPYEMPAPPLPSNDDSARPASSSASSVERTAITATRPMLRVLLRVQRGGNVNAAARAASLMFGPSYSSRELMS